MSEAKPFEIETSLIAEAWYLVRKNKGAPGVDKQSIRKYEEDVSGNLYRLWNRMSSGTYFPSPVRLVEIPKPNGGTRPLGIPTVEDRIAQQAAVICMNPRMEKMFHPDSYGYRPNKSAHDAVAKAKERSMKYNWVLDMDISKFFDTIDHELLMKAVKWVVKEKWVVLYIGRWLKVPYQLEDGTLVERTMGVPQGSVIGPVLANLFLHITFDKWMTINFKDIPFERYADDTICHCQSLKQAQDLYECLKRRFARCGLKLNEDKTKIVYCKDSNRKYGKNYETSFDFLGFTFKGRAARNSKTHQVFTSFLPAMKDKAIKKAREAIKGWKCLWNYHLELPQIAQKINDVVRGWIEYYSKQYVTVFRREVMDYLNSRLAIWCAKKYKNLRRNKQAGYEKLAKIAYYNPDIFVHWQAGFMPYSGKIEKVVQPTLFSTLK